MTTIAWDGTYLAADKQMGGRHTAGKVFPLGDGHYLAGAGYYDQIVEVVHWINQGAVEDAKPRLSPDDGSDILLVEPDGTAYWLTWPYLRRIKLNEPYASVGSGGDYALGAMAMGASARKAVSIAMRFDPYTGKGITNIKVRK